MYAINYRIYIYIKALIQGQNPLYKTKYKSKYFKLFSLKTKI